MADVAEVKMFPVQIQRGYGRDKAVVRESVYMRAYEVYSHVYAPQQAMIDHERGCRGGFGVGEMIAFLYASGFPKDQWRARVDEAFKGMNIDH